MSAIRSNTPLSMASGVGKRPRATVSDLPARARSRGQALSEFLAVSFALLPLFLLMPMIAKYQDIAHSTQMASRYVALESLTRNDSMSTWKPETQLAQEVRRRFFSNTEAPIKTNDTAGNFRAHQNAFWRDPKDNPLIADFDNDINVSFGFAQQASHNNAFSSAADGDPFPIKGELDLKARGIYTANVTVALADLPGDLKFYKPFDNLKLSMTRSTSVIFDPWTANTAAQIEDKIGSNPKIFPAGPLRDVATTVSGVVTAIDWPGAIRGPKLGQLEFWRDVVPDDRLR